MGYPALAALILMAGAGSGCVTAPNPLIGTWIWDNAKTRQEFQAPTEGSAALMKSVQRARTLVASNADQPNLVVKIIYKKNKWTEVMADNAGNELSRKSVPYRIVEVNQDYVVTDDLNGVGKLFFEGTHFYVEVKAGDFTFNDYFTKID